MKQHDNGKQQVRGSDESLGNELIRELKHLRTIVREAGENLIMRKEGEIEAIIADLGTLPAPRLKTEAPHWLRNIKNHEAKPAKGRLRDLRRLSELIDDLADEVLCAQTPKKTRTARTTE
jgi:hypothetical protein